MVRRLALTLLALASALTGTPSHGVNQGTRAMTASATLTRHLDGLADAVLQRRDEAAIDALPLMAARLGFEGMLLAAPKRVDWARDTTLTGLLLSGLTDSRSRALNWHRNTIVLATDLDRGAVYAGSAFPRREDKSPGTPLPPTDELPAKPNINPTSAIPPPPEAAAIGTAWMDLAGLLRLPRQTMRLAVRVLYFDQVSNAAQVQAIGVEPPAGPRPMADGLAILGRLAASGQRPSGLPVFKRSAQTPELASIGATFRVGRIGSALPLHAALKLQATAPMLLRVGEPPASPNARPLPSAIVRATIVLVQRDHPVPVMVPIEFPIWSARPLSPGDPIEAAFSIDLREHVPADALQAGAQLYLAAGPHLAGPIALTP